VGDLSAARHVRAEALRWCERFADEPDIAWERVALAELEYHTGAWDSALETCAELVSHPAVSVAQYAAGIRGRLVLRRGDAETALADARRVIDYGSHPQNTESLLGGLVLSAMAYSAMHDRSRARDALDQFHERWSEVGGMPSMAFLLAEVAAIDTPLDRLAAAASALPKASPWRSALEAVVDHRHDDAAEIYRRIGSNALADQALHMAAEALASPRRNHPGKTYARLAADFDQRAGATQQLAPAVDVGVAQPRCRRCPRHDLEPAASARKARAPRRPSTCSWTAR